MDSAFDHWNHWVIRPLVVFGLLIASASHLCAAGKEGDEFFERRIRPNDSNGRMIEVPHVTK